MLLKMLARNAFRHRLRTALTVLGHAVLAPVGERLGGGFL